ncbi:hypothetical protein [Mesorhizobium sp. CA12]|uniref:hypothetical protein n=1 Tax=Mesorhizobium sp. CA12 TaxID=2876644 RepID=UPI001CCA0654|nr:hypothetical protein [Mesorhizobium sp. CA12]MBZ9859906.1 hypothetical protein [Mesorhizobium sp. CA12]
MLLGLTPLTASQQNPTFYDALRQVGLATSLGLVVDSGDIKSYTGSGQVFTDVSGNGINFNLGATSSSETSDPTFGGTAGRRSLSEVFTLDGADYFTLAASNPPWVQSMHKDNALWSAAFWFNNATWANALFGTLGSTTGNTGVRYGYDSLGRGTLYIRNAGNGPLTISSTTVIVAGSWNFLGLSMNEALGVNGCLVNTNGTQESFTSTYSSPATGNATFTLQLGCGGNNLIPLANGSQIACAAFWTSKALTHSEMESIRQITRARFKV